MTSTLLIETTWRLNDALSLIRSLQPHVKPIGFHTCLGGGVLNNGSSSKDLDLYFLPMTSQTGVSETAKLLSFLQETWGKPSPMCVKKKKVGELERYVDARGAVRHRFAVSDDKLAKEEEYTDQDDACYLHKLKYTWSGLRIDVFILGTAPSAAAPLPVEVYTRSASSIAEDAVQTFPGTPPPIDWLLAAERIQGSGWRTADRLRDLTEEAQRRQELTHIQRLNLRRFNLDNEINERINERPGE